MALEQRFARSGSILTYDGSPARLAGTLPSSGSPLLPPAGDPGGSVELDQLAADFNNHFKWWMFFYPHYYQHRGDNESFFSPFQRTNHKWQIDKFNPTYFQTIDAVVQEAMRRGIVVQICLFDGPGLKASKDGDRWESNPWNAANNTTSPPALVPAAGDNGGYESFLTDPKMRPYQQAYVEHTLGWLNRYWNVFYELVNEPFSPGDARIDDVLAWADWMTGVVQAKTQGRRLVFWNDFSAGHSGRAVNLWKAGGTSTYPNYPNLHGVIFHGDPENVDPQAKDAKGNFLYAFRDEKLFQASSDGGNADVRDTYAWNESTAGTCLQRNVLFQAHTISAPAMLGIRDARPETTSIVLGALHHRWRRRVPDASFGVRFFPDGVLLAFHESPYAVITRGRFAASAQKPRVQLQITVGTATQTWTISLASGGHALSMTRDDGFHEEFDRLDDPLPDGFEEKYARFLFNWKRVSSSTGGPSYELRFDADRSFLAWDPTVSPPVESTRGDVVSVTGAGQSYQLTLLSLANGLHTYAATFSADENQLTLVLGTSTQVFVRLDPSRPPPL